MPESVLDSVKATLGLSQDDTAFDTELIIFVNSVFSTLSDLGIGPESGFAIFDSQASWEDFSEPNPPDPLFNDVKLYMHLRVKRVFDPPANAQVLPAMKEQILELEWRLAARADAIKAKAQAAASTYMGCDD